MLSHSSGSRNSQLDDDELENSTNLRIRYQPQKPQNIIRVDIFNDIEEPSKYYKLMQLFREAEEGDVIALHINCYGGDVNTGHMIVNGMKQCKGTVGCVVEAPSYSMGSLIALAGQQLYMLPHTYLMFHNYSSGEYGKGNELTVKIAEGNYWCKNLFNDIATPFLTPKEMHAIFKGEDLYIHADGRCALGDKVYTESLDKRKKRHFKPTGE